MLAVVGVLCAHFPRSAFRTHHALLAPQSVGCNETAVAAAPPLALSAWPWPASPMSPWWNYGAVPQAPQPTPEPQSSSPLSPWPALPTWPMFAPVAPAVSTPTVTTAPLPMPIFTEPSPGAISIVPPIPLPMPDPFQAFPSPDAVAVDAYEEAPPSVSAGAAPLPEGTEAELRARLAALEKSNADLSDHLRAFESERAGGEGTVPGATAAGAATSSAELAPASAGLIDGQPLAPTLQAASQEAAADDSAQKPPEQEAGEGSCFSWCAVNHEKFPQESRFCESKECGGCDFCAQYKELQPTEAIAAAAAGGAIVPSPAPEVAQPVLQSQSQQLQPSPAAAEGATCLAWCATNHEKFPLDDSYCKDDECAACEFCSPQYREELQQQRLREVATPSPAPACQPWCDNVHDKFPNRQTSDCANPDCMGCAFCPAAGEHEEGLQERPQQLAAGLGAQAPTQPTSQGETAAEAKPCFGWCAEMHEKFPLEDGYCDSDECESCTFCGPQIGAARAKAATAVANAHHTTGFQEFDVLGGAQTAHKSEALGMKDIRTAAEKAAEKAAESRALGIGEIRKPFEYIAAEKKVEERAQVARWAAEQADTEQVAQKARAAALEAARPEGGSAARVANLWDTRNAQKKEGERAVLAVKAERAARVGWLQLLREQKDVM